MLQIQNISKQYKTGDLIQKALDGVSLNLRDSEFVAILGPSGSGKTTLLNVIGGLDRYDKGDLVINSTSTKKYKDRDWDSYRNHTIGFVFQSYNLIPHQSILSNVELALTISGISRKKRRERARKALEQVGLGDQLHKRPNQMSGGQMQRVAIARALVNDPDILLADEPTGALDSETSVQVMELLKQVARDRLVVMVTHNPELAEEYATRIVKLRDGRIIDDSDPFTPDVSALMPAEHRNMGKASMSFLTALSLSFNNLWTKKGRTFLTSFAGSIGIIGIALIISLSSGVNAYIDTVQKDTMTSYPISISDETFDMASMMGMSGTLRGDRFLEDGTPIPGVHLDSSMLQAQKTMLSSIIENNLSPFKAYLDNPDSEIRQYLGENGVVYTYDVSFSVFSSDPDGKLVSSDADPAKAGDSVSTGGFGMGMGSMTMMNSSGAAENFSAMMAGIQGNTVSQVTTDSYELLHGDWPERYNEVVLVLDAHNSISADVLYQIGLITGKQYVELKNAIANEEEIPRYRWDYAEVREHTFYLVTAADRYEENEDGTFTRMADSDLDENWLKANATQLKITGVIRPREDAANANIRTALAYPAKLTDYIISRTDSSAVVMAQEKTPEINVLTGMHFARSSDEDKIADAMKYISTLGVSDKASLYQQIQRLEAQNRTTVTVPAGAREASGMFSGGTGVGQQGSAKPTDESALAGALDAWLEETPDSGILLTVYEQYVAGKTYDDNLKAFGKISYDAPSSINIYTDSFEDKESVAQCIESYNRSAREENRIIYTDYVALLMSSVTTIVNVISYVLIAFVAVSLVVSSIMIGIITYISVLERTKEIGILRAIGASKGNISQVFNAETFIIGACSGLIGIGVTELLLIPGNMLIHAIAETNDVSAVLPLDSAILLVLLSMGLTMIGGLIPSRKAAGKDPVTALRSE